MQDHQTPSFNLWNEPWIHIENMRGKIEQHSIEQTLLNAHLMRGIYDHSPLVVVGVHRLLVAVLQYIFQPEKTADLKKLWKNGNFPEEPILKFGKSFSHRFDLFSEKEPFLQSSDIPLQAQKNFKPVAYLAPEIPAGTAVTHYRHGSEDDQVFCPVCAAHGLIMIPAFATSGGAGIKPSINGVPPFYVLPGGKSLFESLTASLTRPAFQPEIASKKKDDVWWERKAVVEKSNELSTVGYLHSLTFPARRVRLHPEQINISCSRCNSTHPWMVRKMVFEMGESRPKGSEFWFDPFAAYRIDNTKGPIPVRPNEGKAAWREFASLFLIEKPVQGAKSFTQRPKVLEQIAELEIPDQETYPFRVIGMRTDMKAKIFEWVDAGFDVPFGILNSEDIGIQVQEAINFAVECGRVIGSTFRQYLGGKSKKSERYKGVRTRMEAIYWSALADPFRQYVLKIAEEDQRSLVKVEWAAEVKKHAMSVLQQTLEGLGDDTETLSNRVLAEKWSNIRLIAKGKEYLNERV